MKELGKYIAELRNKRALTLRRVEELTGIPNAYLSQLETGRKTHLPPAKLIFKLAGCLGVTPDELLIKAGYLNQAAVKEPFEKKVERAFRHAVSDPQFRYGENLHGKYDFDIKRFVVELYERATGRILINEPETHGDKKPQTKREAVAESNKVALQTHAGEQEPKSFIRHPRKVEL